MVAHLLDWALHTALSGWAWLAMHPLMPGAIVLALAGGFQFSAMKYHCLDKCRTPLLGEDIDLLGRLFATVTNTATVRLRLEYVTDNACRVLSSMRAC